MGTADDLPEPVGGADSTPPPDPSPASNRKTPEERKELLARAIQSQVVQGSRVESQGDYNGVVVKGHRPNHVLHLILTIITGGAWGLFVWLPIVIFGGEKRKMVTVDEFGNTLVQKV
jgi:hypothetical protein